MLITGSMRGYRIGVSTMLCMLALFMILSAYVDMLAYLVSDSRPQNRPPRSDQVNRTLKFSDRFSSNKVNTKTFTDDDVVKRIVLGAFSKENRENSFSGKVKKQDQNNTFRGKILSEDNGIDTQRNIKNQRPSANADTDNTLNKDMKTLDQDTKEDPSYIIHRKFTESQNSSIFFLGAVGKNSTPSARWDEFAVYGQWYNHDDLKIWSLRCCFKYADGTLIERKVAAFFAKVYYKPGGQNVNRGKLRLWHSTCDNPKKGPFPVPHWISIARNRSCTSPDVSYIEPYLTMKRPPGHLTITTKMAYSKIRPETVVSYMETALHLGIDKVLTYVLDNIDSTIDKILRHYASIGLVDYYKLELADIKRLPRSYPPLGPQYMNDEWLVMRDSLERNMGSEFFGIFDMDEYLIPSGNRTYKQLLRSLRQKFPNASHFFFTNKHFLNEYEVSDPTCTPNCSQFRRHIKTAPSKFDYNSIHEKMILITSRVQTSSIRNHYIASLNGYHVQPCPSDEAFVRHYGSCQRKFTNKVCTHQHKWVEDRSMVQWAKDTIEDKVLSSLKRFVD